METRGRLRENILFMIEKFWDELINYSHLPPGETALVLVKEKEEEHVYQFFMGLNDSTFGTVRSHIIQKGPLPKIKTVSARICKEEQQ